MLLFTKILCPTDFSDPSFEALEFANELALHFIAELFVLHVVAPVPVDINDTMMQVPLYVFQHQQQLEKSSSKKLEEEIAKRISPKVTVHSRVVVGNAADQIVKFADDEKVDLIIISTRGQTGLKRLVFGSVAERVVRLAAQPVLTIRQE
ncbi:universal stress protein [candidate division KSB1 bacterium]|nr:universal stress protein [candidate division KSB1 bacterium]